MFYRALREHGVDSQMVIYPDEGHPIKQLPHQHDILRRVLDWFDRHDVPAPDPVPRQPGRQHDPSIPIAPTPKNG
jgi:hypothetical protein